MKGRRDRPGLRAHRGPRAQKGTRDRLDLPVRRGPKEPKATRLRHRVSSLFALAETAGAVFAGGCTRGVEPPALAHGWRAGPLARLPPTNGPGLRPRRLLARFGGGHPPPLPPTRRALPACGRSQKYAAYCVAGFSDKVATAGGRSPTIRGAAAMQQVADWLEKRGLGQYARRFSEKTSTPRSCPT